MVNVPNIQPKTAWIIVACTSVLACVAIGLLVYVYRQYSATKALLTRPDTGSREIQLLVDTIGVFMELPKGEVPTLATVSDVNKLPPVPVFAGAKNGDKILIYQQHAKAIIYRPSTKKVIEVAVFSPPSGERVTKTSETLQEKKLTVVIRSGIAKANAASLYEKVLLSNQTGLVVVEKDNAARKNHEDTLLIPLTGAGKSRASQLARQLGVAVASLPSGEETSSADILIIIGSDIVFK